MWNVSIIHQRIKKVCQKKDIQMALTFLISDACLNILLQQMAAKTHSSKLFETNRKSYLHQCEPWMLNAVTVVVLSNNLDYTMFIAIGFSKCSPTGLHFNTAGGFHVEHGELQARTSPAWVQQYKGLQICQLNESNSIWCPIKKALGSYQFTKFILHRSRTLHEQDQSVPVQPSVSKSVQ